jgi:D-citramalate synthase
VHADGDRKGNLYTTRLSPDRFGRTRAYALGKHSGRASIEQNLGLFGIALTAHQRDRLLARVVALGDEKRTIAPADLPALVDALRTENDFY